MGSFSPSSPKNIPLTARIFFSAVRVRCWSLPWITPIDGESTTTFMFLYCLSAPDVALNFPPPSSRNVPVRGVSSAWGEQLRRNGAESANTPVSISRFLLIAAGGCDLWKGRMQCQAHIPNFESSTAASLSPGAFI